MKREKRKRKNEGRKDACDHSHHHGRSREGQGEGGERRGGSLSSLLTTLSIISGYSQMAHGNKRRSQWNERHKKRELYSSRKDYRRLRGDTMDRGGRYNWKLSSILSIHSLLCH